MRKYVLLVLLLAFGMYMFGCAKKETTVEEMQEPMSMESLATVNTTNPAVLTPPEKPQASGQVAPSGVTVSPDKKLSPLPPAGPYKPSNKEIQTALKNSGYYTGEVDGKIGPKSKQAIEAFQKANNLKADGKVGPKTWELLSTHLNSTVSSSEKTR